MNTLGKRIDLALERIKANQAGLAHACDVTAGAVTQWKTGKTKMSAATAIRASGFLGVNLLWLTEGTGPMLPSDNNVSAATGPRGSVPLISSVQAGNFTEAIDNLHPGEGERIDVTIQVRPHTFALRVSGDSMEPEFPAGIIVVVEPEMEPHPGDYVIAKNGDDATLKQLIKDGADWYLKPSNPRYPIKPLGQAHIIGVVREAVRKYR